MNLLMARLLLRQTATLSQAAEQLARSCSISKVQAYRYLNIEAALVYSPDRLSRKYAYQVLLTEELSRCGVYVVFLKAPSGLTPEDQLRVQFQGLIAESERAQIAERSRRGKRHRAQPGSINVLSGAPYGYRHLKGPVCDNPPVRQDYLDELVWKSRTSNQLRDAWKRYIQGWWGYYRLAEDRKPMFRLEQWIRRHIRKCFWLRWHKARGGKGRCDVWGSIPDPRRRSIPGEAPGLWPPAESCTRPCLTRP